MGRIIKICCFFCFFLLFLTTTRGYGIWQGPIEVLSGSWGKAIGEFGFVNKKSEGFPRRFLVDIYGNIIVSDTYNRRVQVFWLNGNKTAFSYKDLNPGWEILEWPSESIGIYDNKFVEGGFGKFQYYDYQGNLIWEFRVPDCVLKEVNDDGSLFLQNYKTGIYYKFSSKGQLIKKFKSKPLELGIIKEQNLGRGHYRAEINYPDINYTINKGPYQKFIHGCNKSLFGVSFKSIEIFNDLGDILGELVIPEDQHRVIRPAGRGFEEISEVQIEYGQPVVALNGDVYTWKRTTDKYSILKWIWVDGPDVPQNLVIKSSEDCLLLSWKLPAQGAKKVTAYELVRSTEICGTFTMLNKVTKNILQYEDREISVGQTYYYKVRAIRDKEYSEYSNKAIGRITK
ncbi:MAG: hypothetical protein ACMUIP_16565 [bacterium]